MTTVTVRSRQNYQQEIIADDHIIFADEPLDIGALRGGRGTKYIDDWGEPDMDFCATIGKGNSCASRMKRCGDIDP